MSVPCARAGGQTRSQWSTVDRLPPHRHPTRRNGPATATVGRELGGDWEGEFEAAASSTTADAAAQLQAPAAEVKQCAMRSCCTGICEPQCCAFALPSTTLACHNARHHADPDTCIYRRTAAWISPCVCGCLWGGSGRVPPPPHRPGAPRRLGGSGSCLARGAHGAGDCTGGSHGCAQAAGRCRCEGVIRAWVYCGSAVLNTCHGLPEHGHPASRALPTTCRLPTRLNPPSRPLLHQFERERSRELGKELLAARERWRAAEADRAAAEDSRRSADTGHLPACLACLGLPCAALLGGLCLPLTRESVRPSAPGPRACTRAPPYPPTHTHTTMRPSWVQGGGGIRQGAAGAEATAGGAAAVPRGAACAAADACGPAQGQLGECWSSALLPVLNGAACPDGVCGAGPLMLTPLSRLSFLEFGPLAGCGQGGKAAAGREGGAAQGVRVAAGAAPASLAASALRTPPLLTCPIAHAGPQAREIGPSLPAPTGSTITSALPPPSAGPP